MSQDLSRIYREGAREEPPAWLDERIRAAARDDIGEPRGWVTRWRHPLAIAAVITLSVGMTWMMHVERPDLLDPQPVERDELPVEARITLESPLAASSQATERGGSLMRAAPPPSLERRAPVIPPQPALQSSEQASPDTSNTAGDAAMPAPSSRQERFSAASPPMRKHAAPPPAGATPRAALEGDGPAPERSSSAAQPAMSDPVAARRERHTYAAATEDPERWLRQIEDLVRQGREQEARESLDALRRRYPGYAVPENLLQ